MWSVVEAGPGRLSGSYGYNPPPGTTSSSGPSKVTERTSCASRSSTARPRILVVVTVVSRSLSVAGALVVQSTALPAWPETTRLPAAEAEAGSAASAATATARERRCIGWLLQTASGGGGIG